MSDTNTLEKEIQRTKEFVAISNGTLLTCCRESKAFCNIVNQYQRLDILRAAWLYYLFKNLYSKQPEHFETWMDAWNSFEEHARTTAVKEYKAYIKEKFDGKVIRTMKPTSKHCGYVVQESRLNKSKVFNNGEVRAHRSKNSDNFSMTFCVTFLFSLEMAS